MQRGSPPACIFGRLPLLRLACFCRRQRLSYAAKHASLHLPQAALRCACPGLRPRPCRGSEFFTAPLPGGWADSVSERLCGCKQPATRRRSLWFRAPVRGRGRRPGGSAKRAGGWVKILPQRERQSCRYPIRRGASRFGRSCPRAAGPARRSPISRREQNKKSLLQNGSRDLVKLWTHRAAGREPHKENRTLPPAGRSLSRSRCPVQSKSPRSQKQEQGLGFLDWARRSLHGYSGAAQAPTKMQGFAAR